MSQSESSLPTLRSPYCLPFLILGRVVPVAEVGLIDSLSLKSHKLLLYLYKVMQHKTGPPPPSSVTFSQLRGHKCPAGCVLRHEALPTTPLSPMDLSVRLPIEQTPGPPLTSPFRIQPGPAPMYFLSFPPLYPSLGQRSQFTFSHVSCPSLEIISIFKNAAPLSFIFIR